METETAPSLDEQAELGVAVGVVLTVEDGSKLHAPPLLRRTVAAPRPQHVSRTQPAEGGDEFGANEMCEGHGMGTICSARDGHKRLKMHRKIPLLTTDGTDTMDLRMAI
jgi:hypothetical protein